MIFVKSLIPIEIVLLDRGFYMWGVIKVLKELKLGYILLVPKYDKFKEWLGGAARASRETEQREDNIQNKHVYRDIAGL